MIFIDHIKLNFISSYTLQRFAFLDAADVFVFISGYVIGMVYTKELSRGGFAACRTKALRRCVQIYKWHLFTTAATLLVLYALTLDGFCLRIPALYAFQQSPFSTCFRAATLLHTPHYLGILPLYLFLTMLTPIAVYFIERRNWAFLVCCVGAYLTIQLVPGDLARSDYEGTVGYFNILAWQFVFVLGILLGNHHLHGHRWSMLRRTWLRVASLIAAVSVAFVRLASTSPRLATLLHTQFWLRLSPTITSLADKETLGPLRLLSLLIFVVLLNPISRHHSFWNTRLSKGVIRCGQSSLQVFGMGVVLSYIASAVVCHQLGDKLVALCASMIGVAALFTTANVLSSLKNPGALDPSPKASRMLAFLMDFGVSFRTIMRLRKSS